MTKRNTVDLSHFAFMVGEIGRLQTQTCIPIVAGDIMSLQYGGVYRMPPLRRQLVVDAVIDKFIFYVKHRHIYGSDWEDFIKQGIDETVTFTGLNLGGINIEHLGMPMQSGTIPAHLMAGYNRIWNRYFRVPTDTAALLADSDFESTTAGASFGRRCARLKQIWTTGIDATTDASDREVDVVANKMDILDLAQIKARYRTEQERDFFNVRYSDVHKNTWGSGVNTDADERPTLVHRETSYMSGYDVDGTGDANLGNYSGKSASVCGINMPRREFPEHGSLYVMSLMRFPTIAEQEIHYLHKKPNPTYLELACDYDLMSAQPPIVHQVQDFFAETGSAIAIGTHAYGQWYRSHPTVVHDRYGLPTGGGFPFVDVPPASLEVARYTQPSEYDPVFQTTQFGHWTSNGRLDITCHRTIPKPTASIFAGS